jgi:hypothetical protein
MRQVEKTEPDEDQQEDTTVERKFSGPHFSKQEGSELVRRVRLFEDHSIFVT